MRNSGAIAVVEGVGDHGCEYMTGGAVVVLGPTGHNFGAGMTNGAAFVYDPESAFTQRINGESVLLEPVTDEVDAETLRSLVEEHVAETGSAHALRLLLRWRESLPAFWKVIPRAALTIQASSEPATVSTESTRGVAD